MRRAQNSKPGERLTAPAPTAGRRQAAHRRLRMPGSTIEYIARQITLLERLRAARGVRGAMIILIAALGLHHARPAAAQDDRAMAAFALGDAYSTAVPIGPVFAGDVDGDRIPDLLLTTGGTLQLWLNDGRGQFPDHVPLPIPSLSAYALADWDGDGRADIMYATAGPDSGLWWMHAQRKGGFDAARLLVTGFRTDRLVVADVDDDGRPDLLTAPDRVGLPCRVLLDRYPSAPVVVPGLEFQQTLATTVTGDWNRDGFLDAAFQLTGGALDTVVIAPGDGTGHFRRSATGAVIGGEIVPFDFDGDGVLDLVSAAYEDFTVLHNAGDGIQWERTFGAFGPIGHTFSAAVWQPSGPGAATLFVGSADIDPAIFSAPIIYRYQSGDSSDAWQRPAVLPSLYGHTHRPRVLLADDLNGDARPDLVVARDDIVRPTDYSEPDGVLILLSRSSGILSGLNSIQVPRLGAMTVARFGHQAPPALVTSAGSELLAWQLGELGELEPAADFGPGSRPHAIAIDQTGVDALVFDGGPQTTVIARVDQHARRLRDQQVLAGTFWAAGDLDGDGDPEIIVRGADGHLRVAWNERHGRFDRITDTDIVATLTYGAFDVVADVIGDGRARLVRISQTGVGSYGPSTLRLEVWDLAPMTAAVRIGVTEQQVEGGFGSASEVAIGDLDGQPGDEIVVLGYMGDSGGELEIFHGLGDGRFEANASPVYAASEAPGGLAIGDFDGDGHADITLSTYLEARLEILWNDGNGRFGDRDNTSLMAIGQWWHNTNGGTVGDIDGDGRPDILLERDLWAAGTNALDILYGKAPARKHLTVVPRAHSQRAALSPEGDGVPQLESVTPNPVRTSMEVRFALAGDSPARLELLDVAGRRMRAMDLDGASARERTTRFEIGAGTPAGLYWLRLTQAGRSVTTRVVVLK